MFFIIVNLSAFVGGQSDLINQNSEENKKFREIIKKQQNARDKSREIQPFFFDDQNNVKLNCLTDYLWESSITEKDKDNLMSSIANESLDFGEEQNKKLRQAIFDNEEINESEKSFLGAMMIKNAFQNESRDIQRAIILDVFNVFSAKSKLKEAKCVKKILHNIFDDIDLTAMKKIESMEIFLCSSINKDVKKSLFQSLRNYNPNFNNENLKELTKKAITNNTLIDTELKKDLQDILSKEPTKNVQKKIKNPKKYTRNKQSDWNNIKSDKTKTISTRTITTTTRIIDSPQVIESTRTIINDHTDHAANQKIEESMKRKQEESKIHNEQYLQAQNDERNKKRAILLIIALLLTTYGGKKLLKKTKTKPENSNPDLIPNQQIEAY